MWDLWWTEWHWERIFSGYFKFPVPLSFHKCSILIFIFIPSYQEDIWVQLENVAGEVLFLKSVNSG
jgi:hypothetical protein